MIFAGVLVDYRGDFRLLRLYDGLLQQARISGGVGAKDQRERLDCHGHGSGVALVGGLAQRRDGRSKTRYRLLLLPLLLPPPLRSKNVLVSVFAIFVKILNKHYYYYWTTTTTTNTTTTTTTTTTTYYSAWPLVWFLALLLGTPMRLCPINRSALNKCHQQVVCAHISFV